MGKTDSLTPTTLVPLAPAHLIGLGAFQLAIPIFFVNPYLAAAPLSLFVLFCLFAPFFQSWQFFLPITRKGLAGGVALTFDDGPDPETTPFLLDLLQRNNVKASFFVVGQKAQKHPELIRAILESGHEIGNHSYSHDPLLMLRGKRRLCLEIERADDVLKTFGIHSLGFRPPVGITNPSLFRVLLERGLFCAGFSCRAGDFGNRRIKGLTKTLLARVRERDVLLLHDVNPGGDFKRHEWLEEIERLFKGLKSKGLELRTYSEHTGQRLMETRGEKNHPVAQFYDALAADYDREQEEKGRYLRQVEMALVMKQASRLVMSGARVLEIGAGSGRFSIPLSHNASEWVAVDVSGAMLDQLQKKWPADTSCNLVTKSGDIRTLDLDGEFDLIVSFSSLEYIPDLETLFSLLATHLKPGGQLYFTTAHRGILRFFVQLGNAMRQGIWLHARSCGSMRSMLKNTNLTPIHVQDHVFRVPLFGGFLLEAWAKKENVEE